MQITKEKEYLITREDFMKETGVFVSPLYYEYIYEDELEKLFNEGLSKDEVIKKWLDENESLIIETEFSGKFKYLFEDDTVCSMDIEEPTALDIINWLAEYHDELLSQRDALYSSRQELLDTCKDIMENYKKAIKTDEIFSEAFFLLLDKFKTEIQNDNFLCDSLMLLLKDNKITEDKATITDEEYKQTEFLTKKEDK